MPEMIHYVVTQTRVVRVSANDELGAARVANEAFESNSDNIRLSVAKDGIWGNTNSAPQVTELRVSKER